MRKGGETKKGVRTCGETEEDVRKGKETEEDERKGEETEEGVRKGQGDEFYRESRIGEWKKNKETFKYGRRYKEEKQRETNRS